MFAGQTQPLSDVLADPNLTARGSLQTLLIKGPGAVAVAGMETVPVVEVESGGNLMLQGGALNTDPVTIDVGGNVTGKGTITASGGTLDITGRHCHGNQLWQSGWRPARLTG